MDAHVNTDDVADADADADADAAPAPAPAPTAPSTPASAGRFAATVLEPPECIHHLRQQIDTQRKNIMMISRPRFGISIALLCML
eukprot:6196047-Pleurochrysis_carterae.AAC.8